VHLAALSSSRWSSCPADVVVQICPKQLQGLTPVRTTSGTSPLLSICDLCGLTEYSAGAESGGGLGGFKASPIPGPAYTTTVQYIGNSWCNGRARALPAYIFMHMQERIQVERAGACQTETRRSCISVMPRSRRPLKTRPFPPTEEESCTDCRPRRGMYASTLWTGTTSKAPEH